MLKLWTWRSWLFLGVAISVSQAGASLNNGCPTPMPDPMAPATEPLKAFMNQVVYHSLYPDCEEDEAYTAMREGHFSAMDERRLAAGSSEDYFAKMDYGVTLPRRQTELAGTLQPFVPGISSADAVARMARGRNNWIVWTGGNDRFWDYMNRATLGALDFLKTLSDHPSLPATRANRWRELGLVNEPCFKMSSKPRADRWGLYLPERIESKDCPADPFEDQTKYPGVMVGSRGKTLRHKYDPNSKSVVPLPSPSVGEKFDAGSYYGYATGVVGLRLFPNPDFDNEAAKKWDPERFYNDPGYYYDPKLVRPYRVGMSCGFCHVGPNPSRPPQDFNNPGWENLSSNPGAQYYWVDRIFDWNYKKDQDNFVVQILRTARPGTLDTSLISSDMINNPRTMNAVYDLPARVMTALKMNHLEQLEGGETLNAQFNTLPNSGQFSPLLQGIYSPPERRVLSPRVLKDGSDSVGALGALNRVYVNIGLFSEEWIQNFIPLVGGPVGTPFRIEVAKKKSIYWRATESQTPDLGLFFLAASRPDKLADAPGGGKYLKDFKGQDVTHGKILFARNCAQCHSSKLPEKAYSYFGPQANDPTACIGSNYMNCWNKYWNEYARGEEFKSEMEKMVLKDDFLTGNYLSTEFRVPVNLLDSQLCSAIATNAIRDDIWDNFSSESYKNLPSVGQFTVNYPVDSGVQMYHEDVTVPGGGRGFFRPASLISAWSTAPFLQNNSAGRFDWRGTVEGRMSSFNDSIRKLLWPQTRGEDASIAYGTKAVKYVTNFGDELTGVMDVTTVDSYLKIPLKTWQAMTYGLPAKDLTDDFFWLTDKLGVTRSLPAGAKNAEMSPMVAGGADEDKVMIKLGPIPKGTPVNLLANLNLKFLNWGHQPKEVALADVIRAIRAVYEASESLARNPRLSESERLDFFMRVTAQPLLKVSRCKDFVVNRGHYFGTEYSADKSEPPMSDDDKADLIEFIKHM